MDDRQLETWTGEFGNDYIQRNAMNNSKISLIAREFGKIISLLDIRSILEVGSNIGINLAAIKRIVEENVDIYAVEPNKKAYSRLIEKKDFTGLTKAWNCDAFNLPLSDDSIDFVFTSGVLIHIHPDNLGKAMDEIVRVSKKYVLCMEYFSHDPLEKPYRGEKGLLFTRDFGGYYLDRFDNLECVDYGFIWQRANAVFDNTNWWLFRKS